MRFRIRCVRVDSAPPTGSNDGDTRARMLQNTDNKRETEKGKRRIETIEGMHAMCVGWERERGGYIAGELERRQIIHNGHVMDIVNSASKF